MTKAYEEEDEADDEAEEEAEERNRAAAARAKATAQPKALDQVTPLTPKCSPYPNSRIVAAGCGSHSLRRHIPHDPHVQAPSRLSWL